MSTETLHREGDGMWRSFVAAARFWEPRRLPYNLVLAAVVIFWIAWTWPHFRPAFHLVPLLQLVVLAILANVCYSAAYFADLVLQAITPAGLWKRERWVLWVAGTLFAFVFTNYWIGDEIYPFVR